MDRSGQTPTLEVRQLLSEEARGLDLRLLAGAAGLTNAVRSPQIQKPGLALAGFFEYLHPGRVQILGRSEVEFLAGLPDTTRRQVIERLASSDPACFVVTRALPAPPELLEECERRGIPALATERLSGETVEGIHRFLEERLAPFTALHGVLIDVYGLGVLLLGDSGVGKSECALDLIVRGTASFPTTWSRPAGWETLSSDRARTSRATTWRCAGSGSSTSRTCSASRRSASASSSS